MRSFSRRILLPLAIIAAVLQSAGCATVNQRVDILYSPVATVRGEGGTIYLARGAEPAGDGARSARMEVGEIRDGDGRKIAPVATGVPPADLVMDALTQELRRAGYTPLAVTELPPDVGKGLMVGKVVIRLDVIDSQFKAEATCRVKLAVEPRRNGRPLKKLEYESSYADTVVTGRDRLPAEVLLKSMQGIMAGAVPDIVRIVEGRQAPE
jgi:hypothetical protein